MSDFELYAAIVLFLVGYWVVSALWSHFAGGRRGRDDGRPQGPDGKSDPPAG